MAEGDFFVLYPQLHEQASSWLVIGSLVVRVCVDNMALTLVEPRNFAPFSIRSRSDILTARGNEVTTWYRQRQGQ